MLEIANAYRIESPGDLRNLVAGLKKRFNVITPLIETAPAGRIMIEDPDKDGSVAGYINPEKLFVCAYKPLYIYSVTRIPSVRLDDYLSEFTEKPAKTFMEKSAKIYRIVRGDPIVAALEEEDFVVGSKTSEGIDRMNVLDILDGDNVVGYVDLPTQELFADLSTRLHGFAQEYYPDGYFCI